MKIKGLLLDLGGVLFVGEKPIEGAIETLKELRKQFKIRFVTNTSRTVPKTVYDKLLKMGFELKEEEIFSALSASKSYLEAHGAGAYILATKEADVFLEMPDTLPLKYVLVSDAYDRFDYEKLNHAYRLLLDGAQLLGVAKNYHFKDSDEKLSLDSGVFVEALEHASGQKALILGKPSCDFFASAISSMGLSKEEVLMVGDDIVSDVEGAQRCGIKAVQVKTGKFRPEDLQKGIEPDYIIEDITQLTDLVLDEISNKKVRSSSLPSSHL